LWEEITDIRHKVGKNNMLSRITVLLTTVLWAQTPAWGPPVGQKVPDFSLPDQTGRPRALTSLLGPRGAVLVFYRSADW
jgi:hypothetical protein